MSEGIDYAEMLEIPVATVNVAQKKHRFFDLKTRAVEKVNAEVEAEARDKTYAGNEFIQEEAPMPELTERDEEPLEQAPTAKPNVWGRVKTGWKRVVSGVAESWKGTHPVLVAEGVAAVALCGVIFFTNVFMSNSAINTFLRTVLNGNTTVAAKTYADFTLTPVVSEYAEVQTTVSDGGVLSFTAPCSVYPACDATVGNVTRSGDTYTVVLSHSEGFESVYGGLSEVYCQKGDAVFSNLPFARSDGKNTVQVSFYQDGSLLNCYSVDAQNRLRWNA